jgi:hypothetical protein
MYLAVANCQKKAVRPTVSVEKEVTAFLLPISDLLLQSCHDRLRHGDCQVGRKRFEDTDQCLSQMESLAEMGATEIHAVVDTNDAKSLEEIYKLAARYSNVAIASQMSYDLQHRAFRFADTAIKRAAQGAEIGCKVGAGAATLAAPMAAGVAGAQAGTVLAGLMGIAAAPIVVPLAVASVLKAASEPVQAQAHNVGCIAGGGVGGAIGAQVGILEGVADEALPTLQLAYDEWNKGKYHVKITPLLTDSK